MRDREPITCATRYTCRYIDKASARSELTQPCEAIESPEWQGRFWMRAGSESAMGQRKFQDWEKAKIQIRESIR